MQAIKETNFFPPPGQHDKQLLLISRDACTILKIRKLKVKAARSVMPKPIANN
jgi:hypothetical protein